MSSADIRLKPHEIPDIDSAGTTNAKWHRKVLNVYSWLCIYVIAISATRNVIESAAANFTRL